MLESIGLEVAAAYKNAQLYAAAVENADRDSVTGYTITVRSISASMPSSTAPSARRALWPSS
jgi:hypothetical protein